MPFRLLAKETVEDGIKRIVTKKLLKQSRTLTTGD